MRKRKAVNSSHNVANEVDSGHEDTCYVVIGSKHVYSFELLLHDDMVPSYGPYKTTRPCESKGKSSKAFATLFNEILL